MKVEKLCNFYASKYHLSIILLEYLKEVNLKKQNIITFMQDEIEDEMTVLIDKYKYDLEKISNINLQLSLWVLGRNENKSEKYKRLYLR